MSKAVDNYDSDIQDDPDIRPVPPSLELASRDGLARPWVPPLTLRRRHAAPGHCDHPKRECTSADHKTKKACAALTSYNSVFLQSLFQDIADADDQTNFSNVPESIGETAVPAKATVQDDDDVKKAAISATPSNDSSTGNTSSAACIAVVAVSDFNLAKRRRVSTTKSLEQCGMSRGNLASFLQTSAFAATNKNKKGSSHSFLPTSMTAVAPLSPKNAAQLELPATVSAFYSFQLDQSSSEIPKNPLVAHGSYDVDDEEGDFGWFVDTSCDGDDQLASSSFDPYATTQAPLAFAASAVAPRAPTKDHRAEETWAAAADMVDDVLGDLF